MKIPDGIRNRHIYVVCNDTLVENPKIVSFINRTLELVQKSADEEGLPISVHRTTPRLEDTFWVNLLSKGDPAPTNPSGGVLNGSRLTLLRALFRKKSASKARLLFCWGPARMKVKPVPGP